MSSRQLPGKIVMRIGGRPLLVYLEQRISKARTLDNILVATTTNARDNDFGLKNLIEVADEIGVRTIAV